MFPIQQEYHDPSGSWDFPPKMEKFRVPFPHQVPWEDAEVAYKTYKRRYHNDQTLERLAERGGFGGYEFVMYYYDIEDNDDFWDHCREYMAAYNER